MTDRPEPRRPSRIKFSNPQIDAELAGRVRDVVRGMHDEQSPGYTLRQFVEEAFLAHCEAMEKVYHGGERWPHNDAPLEAGRPGGE